MTNIRKVYVDWLEERRLTRMDALSSDADIHIMALIERFEAAQKKEITVKAYEMAINEVFQAYSVDIFPRPTDQEYEAMNKRNSSFVSRHAAHVGRHIAGVIHRRALEFAIDLVEAAEGK